MSVIIHQVNNTDRTDPNGQVNALTDRRWYDFLINQSGVVNGAVVTALSGLQMQISAGWGVVLGCLFTISAETITATASSSGTVDGRLLLEIDTATGQGQFVTQAQTPLPGLVQEDINTSGTVYQLPLATYKVSELSISNLAYIAPIITPISSTLSSLQSSKQDNITGGASTILSANLTTNRALASNGSGKVAVSSVTTTELGRLSGVTSSVQTQLDAKVPTTRTVNGHALSANVSVTKSDVGLGNVTNNAQMPIAGGTFTGIAYAQSVDGSQTRLRNIKVESIGGSAVSTDYIIMRRKE